MSSEIQVSEPTDQFFKFTTNRPVAILMVVLAVCVFGLISYQQLPVNLMPDISYPSLTVRTEYTGTAPEEIETTISRPVEQALGVVDNLVSISSISKAGQSDVKLEFSWDTDMGDASSDVREKLDQVFLPEEVKRPLILRFDPTLDPIMRFGLYGEESLIYLRYLGEEEIKRALETVPGVAAVKVKGGLEEEIQVSLNEQQITLIGIDIQQIRNRLTQENVNLAGGNLKEGQTEYLVRTMNEFKSVKEIQEVVIGNWNGKEIKIKDVATVSRSFKERELITRLNNIESVEIEIYKEADANIVGVAQNVRDRVFGSEQQLGFLKNLEKKKKEKAKLAKETNGKSKGKKSDRKKRHGEKDKNKKKKGGGGRHGRGGPGREAMMLKQMTNFIAHTLPPSVKIDLLSDQSVFIKNSVDEVKSTAFIGGILAVIVLFIFLRNLTATLIVGISIPISIIATFAPMKIFDVSLNIMSLGGLALGIGMLVDNSIVVLESIARCRDEGDDLISATTRGVSEVGGAVFASTLTTVAVFFPIVFVEGIAGQIFGSMALTVVFSLLASLGVALFLIPMLSSRQTSTFIRGVQVDKYFEGHIFSFSASAHVDELFSLENNENTITKMLTGASLFPVTIGLFLLKVLQAISAFLVFVAKHVVILIAVILSPFFGLARIIRRGNFRITEWIKQNTAQADFRNITYIQTIWPTYLVTTSETNLIEAFRAIKEKYLNQTFLRKVLVTLVAIVPTLVIVIRFISQFVLEIMFRLIHSLVTIIFLLIKTIILILRLILTVPSAFVVWAFNWGYSRIEKIYPIILQRALNNQGVTLGSVGLLFLFTIFVVAPRLGSELIPEVHQGEFNVEVTMPVGTPVEKTDADVAIIQGFIKEQESTARLATVSGTDKTANSNSEEGEHTSKITVKLEREGNIAKAEDRVIKKIRNELQNYPGITWKISRPVLFSFKTPIEVEINGYSLSKLQEFSRDLERRMAAIPGVIDIKSNMQRGNPEVQIIYNRTLLAKYNLNVGTVAAVVRNKIRGDVATEFKEKDRKIDILVRLREQDRESIADLKRIIVNPNGIRHIPLAAVAEITVIEGPSEIRRVDQQRTAVVTANIGSRSLSEISEDIYDALLSMNLPEDFSFRLAGQNKEMETSLNSLKLALALAIFLVYIVMASQFESIIHPFIIIFTIPLALIGVILWFYVFAIPISIVVFLGMIMLAGIVVNNAIVLVDYINKLRERGVDKMEAIVQAGKVRLRPIMMTTSTTVLGLLPMALGLGDGAEIRTPMALTVIIGLLSATVLTLIIIPTVYSLTVGTKEQ